MHTSPLEAPGGGDAGGLNVYVVETARRLARAGVEVEVFTRATTAALPPTLELAPGVLVHNVTAGPYEGLGKADLPAQLCAFTAAVLRAEAARPPGWYEAIHSHYWLSGQVGWLARDRWRVPLIHSAHTLAKVKNAALADGEAPEPLARIVGEEQVTAEADRLIAPTAAEAEQLIDLYGADPQRVVIVAPGVDLDAFTPGDVAAARARVGVAPDATLLLFVGRLQPLKAPDVLIRAAAQLLRMRPDLARTLQVAIVGSPSGDRRGANGYADDLRRLAASLGVPDRVRFVGTVARDELADWYRAADLSVVPSYSESFGLVALESEACGTPVVAADVGGLATAVADGRSGLLVGGHGAQDWARVLAELLGRPGRRAELAAGAVVHAAGFSWDRTTDQLLSVYANAMADFAALGERLRA